MELKTDLKRLHIERSSCRALSALFVRFLLAAGVALAGLGQVQLPQLQGQDVNQGQPPNPVGNAPSPAEYQAFTSALSQSSPAAQAEALQVFLETYPQSALASQARKLLAINAARGRDLRPGVAPRAGVPEPGLKQGAGTTLPARNPAISAMAATSIQTGGAATHRAVIDLAPHLVTIRADNSSLSQIFRDLTASSGMKVEGLTRDERIYGSFGPGDPHDVLAALVNGLGYNFMMVGASSRGFPRQFILTIQAPLTAAGAQPTQVPPGEMEQEEEAVQDEQMPQEVQDPGRAFIPPQNPGAQGPGANRTTQQMLDELRQMHPQPDIPPQVPQPQP